MKLEIRPIIEGNMNWGGGQSAGRFRRRLVETLKGEFGRENAVLLLQIFRLSLGPRTPLPEQELPHALHHKLHASAYTSPGLAVMT
jgi:hypothetical protein